MDDLTREFPLTANIGYLNHAAVGPWPQRTADAVSRFARENAVCGAMHYARWVAVETALRHQLARLINAPSPDDIALLKNTSEALSVVAYGIDWQPGDNIVCARQEFPSNKIVWESLSCHGVDIRWVDLSGRDDPEAALLAAIDARTRLLTVSSVQYADGLRLDLARLGAQCRRRGILYNVDVIQSLGAAPLDVQKIGADFVMADGHKWLLAPEGLALFYCRAEVRPQLKLYQYGWHMTAEFDDFQAPHWHPAESARRFECGSPNMTGIHALHASVSLLLETGLEKIEALVKEKTGYLIAAFQEHPALQLHTPRHADRHLGIVTVSLKSGNNAALHHYLRQHDIITALRGGVRFSPHFYTPTTVLERTVEVVDTFLRCHDRK